VSTIVITGARGYIGSALVSRFASEGHRLCLVSRSAVASADVVATGRYVQADLCDEADWRAILRDAEAVIHLSSRTDLRAAEADPTRDHRINVDPVRALVAAAERSNPGIPVVFASTVTIVGAIHDNPVSELTPDNPSSVYDRHKLECETILRDATYAGVVRACSLRISNVYGYGTASINANRGILNNVMRRAAQGESLTIYGRGDYIRDFIFLGDVVEAFCQAITQERMRNGGHYVIASGRGHTLIEVFALVAETEFRRSGRRIEIRHVPEPADLHPIERRNFVGDSRLFQNLAGWRPRVDVDAGIRDYFAHALSLPAAAVGQ
jgi:UDP-glucose 4-epimerase